MVVVLGNGNQPQSWGLIGGGRGGRTETTEKEGQTSLQKQLEKYSNIFDDYQKLKYYH